MKIMNENKVKYSNTTIDKLPARPKTNESKRMHSFLYRHNKPHSNNNHYRGEGANLRNSFKLKKNV